MKTPKLLVFILGALFMFSCSKKDDTTEIPTTPIGSVSYQKEIKAIMSASCTGCHTAGGAASQSPLDTYELVRDNSNLIIARIELPANDSKVMPRGGKLPQTTIDIIKAWKAQGLPN